MTARVVLVTGASRSGTTMLSRIFGGHSEVLGLKESHFFGDILPAGQFGRCFGRDELTEKAARLHARLDRGLFSATSPYPSDFAFANVVVDGVELKCGIALFVAVTQAMAKAVGKSIACEQTPRNIFYARRLLELNEDFRIVHIVRDPRAVAASQKDRWRRRQLGANRIPIREMVRNRVSYHVFTVTRMWAGATRIAVGLRDHPRFRIVRYEDVVARPEETVRDLCAFLNLDWQPGMLDIPITGSSGQRDLDRRGIAAHRLDTWREVLTPGEIRHLQDECAEHLKRFGYPRADVSESRFGALILWVQFPLHVLATALVNPRRMWIQALAVLRR